MPEEPQDYITDPTILDQRITDLRLDVRTANAAFAGTDDKVYCNVVFKDGSLLFAPRNFELDTDDHDDREPGKLDKYPLPIPNGFTKKIGDIDELYIRKPGSDGWLLGSALLFANGLPTPVIGNSQINQFLDNGAHTLYIRDWSTRSLCSSFPTSAEYPLLGARYRIAGPVLGQVSDTGANVLYRVDREGTYRLRVNDATSGQLVFDEVQRLSPTARFQIRSLQPNTQYTFSFFHVLNGQDVAVADGDGAFRTFPPDGTPVKFSFAFGSCLRNKDNVGQAAWNGIRNLAANPSVDPLANPSSDVRFFIHLGDTFYYYDDVSEQEPGNLRTVLAANLSSRKHPGFLEMARRVPCCAVWDDHDFRKNDGESVPDYAALGDSLEGFLNYWGNDPISLDLGLTTLLSYGNVDVYLLDGRIRRNRSDNTCFSRALLDEVLSKIRERGRGRRLVILASGSTWNHTNTAGNEYGGDSAYKFERETLLYSQLNELMERSITGLVFLSGDIHINEIYEVALDRPGAESKVAPEFVSSPLGGNSSLRWARSLKGERVWSVGSADFAPLFQPASKGRRGFATVEIDTTGSEPNDWTIKASYYDERDSATVPYESRLYTLSERQFKPK